MNCLCGNIMTLKFSRKGETKWEFLWVCSNSPECRITRNYYDYYTPINQFNFAYDDFLPIVKSINEKSNSEKEEIIAGIKVQMIFILRHFISCNWPAHYNEMFDKLIKPYLTDKSTLDYVLRQDCIKESKGNIIRGKTGAKIYPELYYYLINVESTEIKDYLKTEFNIYLQQHL